jgi:hypothetical protein
MSARVALMQRALLGAGLGFAIGLSYFMSALPVMMDLQTPLFDEARAMVGAGVLKVMVIAVLVSLAVGATRGALPRAAAVALAFVLGEGAYQYVVKPLTHVGWFEMNGQGSGRYSSWHIGVLTILLAVYFDQVNRGREMAGRLRAAQLERQHAERSVLESRLHVIRARVDPAFLFESLGVVRRTYTRDVDEAERLLDDLIRFLRASLPRSRERGSTIGEEIHLVAAYLEVVSASRGRVVMLAPAIEDDLGQQPFPPAVLLPLVDGAVRRMRPDVTGPAEVRIHVAEQHGEVRISIEDDGSPLAVPPPELERAAVTLRAFFGEGRVLSRGDAGGSRLALEFPSSPASRCKVAA